MIEFKNYLQEERKSIALCDQGWDGARDEFRADHPDGKFFETKNEHGESYALVLYPEIPFGLLLHSDAGSHPYPVVNGHALSIICSEEERQIVQGFWDALVEKQVAYIGDAECVVEKEVTIVTNNICPLCLRLSKEWSKHHVIWACEGGCKTPENMIRICRDCHSMVTFGGDEKRNVLYKASYFHQLAIHGNALHPRGNGEGRYKDRRYLDDDPFLEKILEKYDRLTEEEKIPIDSFVRSKSWDRYVWWRLMVLEKVSWQSYEEVCLKPSRISMADFEREEDMTGLVADLLGTDVENEKTEGA